MTLVPSGRPSGRTRYPWPTRPGRGRWPLWVLCPRDGLSIFDEGEGDNRKGSISIGHIVRESLGIRQGFPYPIRPPGGLGGVLGISKHLHCIIEVEEDVEFPISHREEGAYTIRYRDLAAVVSDAPFRPGRPAPESLIAHERVIEEVMREFTVLPLRFGTLARGGREVEEGLLKPHFSRLHALLRHLDHKEELSLKVFWSPDHLFSPSQSREPPAPEARGRWEAEYVLARLCPLACEVRANPLLSQAMVLNAAFLVWRDHEEAFDLKVSQISRETEGRLRFKYVGPVPPFDFVPPHLLRPWPD